MAKGTYSGRVFHNFKKRNERIINKLDNGPKKKSVPEKSQEFLPRHKDANKMGRLWTF